MGVTSLPGATWSDSSTRRRSTSEVKPILSRSWFGDGSIGTCNRDTVAKGVVVCPQRSATTNLTNEPYLGSSAKLVMTGENRTVTLEVPTVANFGARGAHAPRQLPFGSHSSMLSGSVAHENRPFSSSTMGSASTPRPRSRSTTPDRSSTRKFTITAWRCGSPM